MNSGSFFCLDLESSKVVDGITYFNYLDLPELEAGEDELSYPVRLSISSDSLSFIVHYYSGDNRDILCHTEEVILNLPYKNQDPEALSSSIKRIYNTSFPLSNYLYKLVRRRYYDYVVEPSGEKSPYESIRKSQINRDSYSSLTIWGMVKRNENGIDLYQLEKEGQVNSIEPPIITKFLRKLLVDFMFDLMHSDVFQCSKYYSLLYDGLMNDFFFSSIVKKSEYYYYRRLVRTRTKLLDVTLFSRQSKKTEEYKRTIDPIVKLYAEKLDQAEKDWIEVLMTPLADKHFIFSPEWYEDHDKRNRKKRRGLFSVSEFWFVNPEEEMQRVVFPLKDTNENTHYLNSYELSELLGIGDNSSVLERKSIISRWFYRRFDFVDTFRIHFFKHWNHFLTLLLLIFCVIAIWPGVNFWNSPHNLAYFPAVISIAFFLAFIVFSPYLRCKESGRIDDLLVWNRRKREGWKSLRFSLFFAAIWVFFYFHDFMTYNWVNVLVIIVVLLGIAVLLLFIIKPRVHIIDNIHLFLPRLVASITTAWIMLVIGNDLVKERISWPTCVILTLVVLAFILYESNIVLPHITNGPRVWRTLELMLISFSISLFIGVLAIDVLSPSLLADIQEAIDCNNSNQFAKGFFMELKENSVDWHFVKGNSNFTISFIPQYLIQFSFLAMFIGVFIQMIFEEKKITEM